MVDRYIRNYLIYACKNGHLNMLQNVDDTTINEYYIDMFFKACLRGHVTLCQWLKDFKTDFDFDLFDNRCFTDMKYKKMDMYVWLSNNHPNFNNIDMVINTFCSACKHGDIDVAKLIYYDHPFQSACIQHVYDNLYFCEGGKNILEMCKWLYSLSYEIIVHDDFDIYSAAEIIMCDETSKLKPYIIWIFEVYNTHNIAIGDEELLNILNRACEIDDIELYDIIYDKIDDKNIVSYTCVFTIRCKYNNINLCKKLYDEHKINGHIIKKVIEQTQTLSIEICDWIILTFPHLQLDIMNEIIRDVCYDSNIKLLHWYIDQQISNNMSPFEHDKISTICVKGGFEIFEYMYTYLFAHNKLTTKNTKNMLDIVCKNGNDKIRNYLLEHSSCKMSKHHYIIALHLACKRGNLDDVKKLYPSICDMTSEDNYICFLASCKKNHLHVCKWLYEQWPDINLHRNGVAFNYAIKNHYIALFKWLYSINNSLLTFDCVTTLIHELRYSDIKLIKWIYDIRSEIVDKSQLFTNIFIHTNENWYKEIYEKYSTEIDLTTDNHDLFRYTCDNKKIDQCRWLCSKYPDIYNIISINYDNITFLIHEQLTNNVLLAEVDVKDCSICYDESKIVATCGHMFCDTCLLQWLNVHNCCPMCRTQIKYSDSSQIKID